MIWFHTCCWVGSNSQAWGFVIGSTSHPREEGSDTGTLHREQVPPARNTVSCREFPGSPWILLHFGYSQPHTKYTLPEGSGPTNSRASGKQIHLWCNSCSEAIKGLLTLNPSGKETLDGGYSAGAEERSAAAPLENTHLYCTNQCSFPWPLLSDFCLYCLQESSTGHSISFSVTGVELCLKTVAGALESFPAFFALLFWLLLSMGPLHSWSKSLFLQEALCSPAQDKRACKVIAEPANETSFPFLLGGQAVS